MMMLIFVAAYCFMATVHVHAQRGADDLYIMIDDVEVNKCPGEPNQIQIRKQDISITDEKGNSVNYIKAPGNIQIRFNRIRLTRALPHISGEISALLEIPLLESSFIRFDFPYSVVPEKRLLNDVCDKESGVVTKDERGNQRTYCRYCDLCATAARTEQALDRDRYLPKLEKDRNELSFRRVCNQLDPKTYSIVRTVQLPGKQELERQANQYFQGIGGEIKRRFNKGKGRFRVKLHLLTSDQPPKSYQETQRQRCQGSGLLGSLTCNLQCNIPGVGENCKSYYAQNCIDNERLAACYTTVFYYRVTDNYREVQEFLGKKGLTDNYLQPGQPTRPTQPTQPQPGQPSTGQGQGGARRNWRRECVSNIQHANVQRFCRNALQRRRWNRQCCRYCPGICPS